MTQPLILADPQFTNPAGLNQEMEQSAEGRAVQIRYSETALNQEIQTLLQNNPKLPYRNVYLDLQRDQAVVTGDVTVLGLQVGAEVVSAVEGQDCRATPGDRIDLRSRGCLLRALSGTRSGHCSWRRWTGIRRTTRCVWSRSCWRKMERRCMAIAAEGVGR